MRPLWQAQTPQQAGSNTAHSRLRCRQAHVCSVRPQLQIGALRQLASDAHTRARQYTATFRCMHDSVSHAWSGSRLWVDSHPARLASQDPMEQFGAWFRDASEHADVEEANAMCLATASAAGAPAARMVLLKDYSAEGFVFYTNHDRCAAPAVRTAASALVRHAHR